MTDHFPQYDENGEEILFFPNVWREIAPQEVLGADCFINPANINNGLNRFVMDITGVDFRKMLSSLYVGAEIAYPQEFMQIIVNFLKMVHCPIDFEEECQTYPTYTPIIQYSPMSPFINPDEIPEGYLVPPFVFVSEENIAEYGDYQIGDVLVPFDSVTFDVDWFETLDGQLPTIAINVEGSGKMGLELLTVPFGGVAIVTVDTPPNLLDILAGIITGADNIVDVNRDSLSVPPETTEHIVFPVDVIGSGMHTVYVVFFPILDDSLIPLRFGGGLRSVELCDFEEPVDMGVTDVRFDIDEMMLQQQKNGVYEDVIDWEFFINYVFDIEDDIMLLDAQVDNIEITVLDTEQTVGEHGERISELEDCCETAQTDIAALQANAISQGTSIENLSTDLEALEDEVAALAASFTNQAMWSEEFDFTASDGGWSGGNPWSSGDGWLISSAALSISFVGANVDDSRITFVVLQLRRFVGTSFISTTFTLGGENSQECGVAPVASGSTTEWMQINRVNNGYTQEIAFTGVTGLNSFYIEKATFWGRGSNPF